jgi:hypothetical protein
MTRDTMVRALHKAGIPVGGTGMEYWRDDEVEELYRRGLTDAQRRAAELEEGERELMRTALELGLLEEDDP